MQEFPLSEQVSERVGTNWMAVGIMVALGATFWWLMRKGKEKEYELVGQKPDYSRRAGVPRSEYERLVNHFGKLEADRLLAELGDGAYDLLPPRGTRLEYNLEK